MCIYIYIYIYSLIYLICGTIIGIKAMEVYRERREHAERGHKDACEEVVGYIQR